MTIAEMLGQSGILTLLGMGVVFSFLIILILCMYALHFFIHLFKLDKEPQKSATAAPAARTVSAPQSAPVAASAQDNGAVVAAIAAALHEKQ